MKFKSKVENNYIFKMSNNDFIEFQQAVIQNSDSVVKRRVKTWIHHISLSGSKRDILSPYVLRKCTHFKA